MTTDTTRSESVWDYPRPPRVEPSARRVRVVVDGITVADSSRAVRVLETSHPPSWYIPAQDVRMDLLAPTTRRTVCEYKGQASYYRWAGHPEGRAEIAWAYLEPRPGYEAIRGHLSFYAGRVDEAWVDEERVAPQEGDFYGGWITSDVHGPFKGGPGTRGW
ncbi:MAG TPA: DUF427 domain-containing protein [Candidatus Deferrimicrobium sp.]|nr:DUF427 domain-containing protein [Candidatus Deferrimicrobium sp.]